jgi:hypothetical protein
VHDVLGVGLFEGKAEICESSGDFAAVLVEVYADEDQKSEGWKDYCGVLLAFEDL